MNSSSSKNNLKNNKNLFNKNKNYTNSKKELKKILNDDEYDEILLTNQSTFHKKDPKKMKNKNNSFKSYAKITGMEHVLSR